MANGVVWSQLMATEIPAHPSYCHCAACFRDDYGCLPSEFQRRAGGASVVRAWFEEKSRLRHAAGL